MQRFGLVSAILLSATILAGCGKVAPPPTLSADQQREMERQLAQVHEQERQHLEQTRKADAAAKRRR
jgi:outer membrane murein-binding lipoprotein Lpp